MKISFELLPVCDLEDLAEAISCNTGFPSQHIFFTLKDEYLSYYSVFRIDYIDQVRRDIPVGLRRKMFDVLFEMMNSGELPERFVTV